MSPAFVAAPLAFREVNDATRVRSFGEVFTPLAFVEKMLALLDTALWSDSSAVFVEPTCGDGAFLVLVVERRYRGFLGDARDGQKRSLAKRMQAMALALDSSFGFDIQGDNVDECRANLLKLVALEIPETIRANSLSKPEGEFLAWACAAIAANVVAKNALTVEKPPMRFTQRKKQRREAACDRMMRELAAFASGEKTSLNARFIEKAMQRGSR